MEKVVERLCRTINNLTPQTISSIAKRDWRYIQIFIEIRMSPYSRQSPKFIYTLPRPRGVSVSVMVTVVSGLV